MNRRLLTTTLSTKFLPHQISTADWILNQLETHKNLLLFHKPGTGKTFIGTIIAEVYSSHNYNVIISASNNNILSIWETHQVKSSNKIYPIKYLTKKGLNNLFDEIIEGLYQENLDNTIIILDEAHEIFNTDIVSAIIQIQLKYSMKLIMLTGTPIINSPKTLTNLLLLLSGKNFTSAIATTTSSVVDIKLKPEYEKEIIDSIRGTVSYYEQKQEQIAKYKIEDLYLMMGKHQSEIFDIARQSTVNEMFQQILMNVSLFAVEDFNKYISVTELNNGTVIGGRDNIVYKNKYLYGNVIDNPINNSCKFMRLRKHLSDPGKMFIYLCNPGYGVLFLKSYFNSLQIEDYTDPTFYPNPLCYCGKSKSEHKLVKKEDTNYSTEILVCSDGQTFSPMKYVCITSTSGLDPSKMIDTYNLPSNDTGREIKIIVGSDIISVAYTLKEVLSIHLISLPNNKGQEEQIIKRVIRIKAHVNPKKTNVMVYRYIAQPRKGEGFDEKRLRYIDMKYSNVAMIDNMLIKSNQLIDLPPNRLFRGVLTRLLVQPPSITESLKRKEFKDLELEPDKTVLSESILVENQIVTRHESRLLQIPYQDHMLAYNVVFSPNNYVINEFAIVERRGIYYHTTNFKVMRNLFSIPKEGLYDLYTLYSMKLFGAVKTLEYSTKNEIIDAIITIVKGTEYFLRYKIDFVNNG